MHLMHGLSLVVFYSTSRGHKGIQFFHLVKNQHFILSSFISFDSQSLQSVEFFVLDCGLLTKCEVKMAGYWPSFFFLHVCGPRQSRGP